MARILCPICRQEFDTQASKAMPFCSPRCKSIDLGRWLNEEYAITKEKDAEVAAFEEQTEEE